MIQCPNVFAIPVTEDEDGCDTITMGAVVEGEDVCCAEDAPSLGSNTFRHSEEHLYIQAYTDCIHLATHASNVCIHNHTHTVRNTIQMEIFIGMGYHRILYSRTSCRTHDRLNFKSFIFAHFHLLTL